MVCSARTNGSSEKLVWSASDISCSCVWDTHQNRLKCFII